MPLVPREDRLCPGRTACARAHCAVLLSVVIGAQKGPTPGLVIGAGPEKAPGAFFILDAPGNGRIVPTLAALCRFLGGLRPASVW